MKITNNKENTQIPVEVIKNQTLKSKQIYFVPTGNDFEHIKAMYENGLLKVRVYQRQAS